MRISRHQLWMGMAEVLTRRSTCYRGNVGAILVSDNDVVSCGYNGPAAGRDHCQGNECPLAEGSCTRSYHAEYNALMRAAAKTQRTWLDNCTLYCTSAPCRPCAELIVASKVACVFFRNYYKTPDGLDLLKSEKQPLLYRLTPSGYKVNERTGVIEDA